MRCGFTFSTPRVGLRLSCVIVVIAMGLSTPTLAQRSVNSNPISPYDRYGNARAINPIRRPIGLFQNNTQRDRLRSYQFLNRRQSQRGGVSPFAIPADRALRASTASVFSSGITLGTTRPVTRRTTDNQQSFSRFGGFGARTGGVQIGDATLAFTRKKNLIQATSLNAPVRRAFWENGISMGLRTSVEKTPYQPHDPRDQSNETKRPTLDEKLVRLVTVSHTRSKEQAWGWFSDGEYRRAIRSFETAIALESKDVESHIGLLFSYLSLRATQTTFAVLRAIHRREVNPFEYDMIITNRFHDPNDVQRLIFQLRTQAQRHADHPDIFALYAFMLWFTGDRDEAVNVMGGDDRKETRSPYDDWYQQMKAIHSSRSTP